MAKTTNSGLRNKTIEFCRTLRQSVCVSNNAYTHQKKKRDKSGDVARWFERAIRDLWPVADGSLSLRKSPCIRKNCRVCASGEGHRSHVLYGRRGGERLSLYVPDDLVKDVEVALANGRRLKDLISQAGERYVRALKEERNRDELPERR